MHTTAQLGLGHEVQAAYDGPSAIEVARARRPHVVLLDIGLPGMDGYSVATQLRAEEDIGEPVLVAITGYGQEEDRRRSHEAGFDFHLVKPIDFNTLRLILERTRQLATSVHRGPSCAPSGKS